MSVFWAGFAVVPVRYSCREAEMYLVVVSKVEQQQLNTTRDSSNKMMMFFPWLSHGTLKMHARWGEPGLLSIFFYFSTCSIFALECCRSTMDIGFNMKFHVWLAL